MYITCALNLREEYPAQYLNVNKLQINLPKLPEKPTTTLMFNSHNIMCCGKQHRPTHIGLFIVSSVSLNRVSVFLKNVSLACSIS